MNWTLHGVCWLTTTQQGCDPITTVILNVSSDTLDRAFDNLNASYWVLIRLNFSDCMTHCDILLKHWILEWLWNLNSILLCGVKVCFIPGTLALPFTKESITNVTSPYVTESSRYHISQETLPWTDISSFQRKAFQLKHWWKPRVCTFHIT